MPGHALRNMMGKFEQTEKLAILRGTIRKRFITANVVNISTALLEASIELLHGSVGVPTISHTLDTTYSIARHIV